MSVVIRRSLLSENTSDYSETGSSSDISDRSISISSDNPSDLSTNPIRHLFLVRHGQYERQRTTADGHLTLKGQKQAWYAARFLISQLPDNILFDSLIHSDSKY